MPFQFSAASHCTSASCLISTVLGYTFSFRPHFSSQVQLPMPWDSHTSGWPSSWRLPCAYYLSSPSVSCPWPFGPQKVIRSRSIESDWRLKSSGNGGRACSGGEYLPGAQPMPFRIREATQTSSPLAAASARSARPWMPSSRMARLSTGAQWRADWHCSAERPERWEDVLFLFLFFSLMNDSGPF